MNHLREFCVNRIAIVCASSAIAILTSAPIFAQQKPIVIEPDAVVPAAAKALTIINKSGSFVLNRNIVNGRAGVDAIDITASNVTLDLQGNSIISAAASTGVGINATGVSSVIIRNGTITGFGGPAIIAGSNANITGIIATQNSLISSTGASIEAGNGSQIAADTISGSGSGGITCGTGTGCLVENNVIQGNSGVGISLSDATGGYLGNVMQGNSGNTVGTTGQVSGGTSLGQNLCNGTPC